MRTSTRGAAVAAAVGVLALALTGCGAGRDAATAETVASVPGVNAGSADGSVLLRNVGVSFSLDGYPSGGTAPVELWLVNMTDDPVRMVDASSEAAGAVVFDEVVLAGQDAAPATLAVTGLTRDIDFATPLPLTLVFDNGAEISVTAPMVPPEDDRLPREPMTFGEQGH